MGYISALEKHWKDFEHGLFFTILMKQVIIWGLFVIAAALLLKLARFPPLGYTTTIIGLIIIALAFCLIYSFELYVAKKYEHLKGLGLHTHKKKKHDGKPLLHVKVHHGPKLEAPPKPEHKKEKPKHILASRYKPVDRSYFKK